MRKFCFRLLFLTFVTATLTDVLLAQYGEEACVVVLTGQNRYRKVAGMVNVECGYPNEIHTAPWGNWGVQSNYGNIKDTDQFRGWKHIDGPRTKLQWNSCTTAKEKFRAPNRKYYNVNNSTKQQSNAVVTHGTLQYRTNVRTCPPPW